MSPKQLISFFAFPRMLLFAIFLLIWSSAYGTSEECLAKGFASPSCSVCDSLKRIVGSADASSAIIDECSSCCVTNAQDEVYKLAVLEVDKRFLQAFPSIKDLITKQKPPKNKGKAGKTGKEAATTAPADPPLPLQIRYKFGQHPHLLLYTNKDDEVPANTISVGNWDRALMKDFLDSHLKVEDTNANGSGSGSSNGHDAGKTETKKGKAAKKKKA